MQILILLLLIILNGLLAMSELAVVSARKTRLRHEAERGNKRAMAALALANDPTRFLSTVQVGITLIGILAGALGGSSVAGSIEDDIATVEPLSRYAHTLAVGIVVLVTTYLSLVIGELVPKRLALHNPERIAKNVAAPMQTLSALGAPIVSLLSYSTQLVLTILRIRERGELPVSDEEVAAMVRHGAQLGVFEAAEQDMVEGVLRLDDLRVDTIMTPRTEIVWLDLDEPLEENLEIIKAHAFTNYPVGEKSIDHVLGVIRVKDLMNQQLAGESIRLRELLQEPLFVPGSQLVSSVLENFKVTGNHVALVIGEYGDVQGLVTLIDILEEIVGDVDLDEPQVVTRKDGSLLADGRLPVHRFKEVIGVDDLPEEETDDYQSLGGFVMSRMGRIPKAADSFEWGGWYFEIMDMDGNRVDKVLLKAIEPTQDVPSTEG